MATTLPESRIIELLLSALGMNAAYVVDLYALYRSHPDTVSAPWRTYFQGIERGEISPQEFPGGAPGRDGADRADGADGRETGPRTKSEPGTPPAAVPVLEAEDLLVPLTGGNALIVANMEASRSVPTATSYRHVPVKLLEENRRLLNHHLALAGEGKLSFTHLIAWAMVGALIKHPGLNDGFAVVDGVPHRVKRRHIHLGIAMDLERKDKSRNLLVPNLRNAQDMDFRSFARAYETVVERARRGKLEPADFQGTTITLTNPGTVGTEASVPRLLSGQGAIIAVGNIGYSAETRAMSPELLSRLGISKRMTVSSTYDHRIVQGAASGLFLAEMERLLLGEDGFYDTIFEAMGVPHLPLRWTADLAPGDESPSRVDEITRQARVLQLINAYRVRGHLVAQLDPLGARNRYHAELDIAYYGLTLWDLDRTFITGATKREAAWVAPQATLREILEMTRDAYCGRVGVEYMNIQDPEQKRWIQERVEPPSAREPLPREQKRRVLEKLVDSETFERFLQTKFLGHKRFSLEGGETLIPILDRLLDEAAAQGIEEVVMGMAHRGRLNVLSNTVGTDPARIFSEFQGTRDPFLALGSGDVKYHLGAIGIHRTPDGREVRLSLAPNPSHLEAVDPVVEGIARAKQERRGAEEGRRRLLPVLIHGDAAFAGQGVVAETLNLSQLRGYRTGGTVHLIVNNQIGFTTPVESARSSPYPTDVAKMCQAPIFHVNGDDPEAAVRTIGWALAYRQTFQRDVVLDLFCYRRHGHNEGDEPSYTQPRLYAKIRTHPSVAELYAARLVREGVLDEAEVESIRQGARAWLEDAFTRSQEGQDVFQPAPLEPGPVVSGRATGVPRNTLASITESLLAVPEGLDLHPKLRKFMEARREVIASGRGVDWAFAEALAFGSLVLERIPVRLSGQDSVRGTFSQRHLLLHDDDTDLSWMALQHLAPDQAPFHAVDSPLSEEAVLGFEYGFTVGDPTTLVLWEAQFGDFVNEAQVVIDQFLAGSERKWGQPSGLVLLLPHGYEGQGPDHSSARLERFLQLAAADNLRVAQCTTPAQYFHLLRRQALHPVRRPLVVMTPKSLLRHPQATSTVDELERESFRPVLPDPGNPGAGVSRLLFCSGKVAYDLLEAQADSGGMTTAVVRVEELYPFPEQELRRVIAHYPRAQAIWVQEEPRNMGGWTYVEDRFRRFLGVQLRYVGRAENATTATGYLDAHIREQARVVEEALRG